MASPEVPRTIVIGDIHGCIVELKELISKLSLTPIDELIFVGDYFHKGPHGDEVIKYIYQMYRNGYDIKLVIGNHEEKQFRYNKQYIRHQLTGDQITIPHTNGFKETFYKAMHYMFFLENQGYVYYKSKHTNVTVVHAGFNTSFKDLGPSLKYYHYTCLSTKAKRKLAPCFRLRHENLKGKMVSLGKEKPEDVFWADVYDGRYGHVIYGHQPFSKQPKINENATGIDLGCVYGGHLCAAIIYPNETQPSEFVMVKAKKAYAKSKFFPME